MKKQTRPVILTCSLCSNFDPNRSICKLNGEPRNPISDEYANHCKREGMFIRDMNVLLDVYNYYRANEEAPYFEVNMDSLPVDEQGRKLFVKTKRGLERAIPANETVTLKGDNLFNGVGLIFTYQGQRELIYELGVDKARKLAEKEGIELTVLPEEKNSQGEETFVLQHQLRENIKEDTQACFWLNDEPNEGWD